MLFIRGYSRKTQETVFDAHDKGLAFFKGLHAAASTTTASSHLRTAACMDASSTLSVTAKTRSGPSARTVQSYLTKRARPPSERPEVDRGELRVMLLA